MDILSKMVNVLNVNQDVKYVIMNYHVNNVLIILYFMDLYVIANIQNCILIIVQMIVIKPVQLVLHILLLIIMIFLHLIDIK